MDAQQSTGHDHTLKTDYFAWRILSEKKRKTETQRNRIYNMRPRLRSDAHH